MSELTKRGFSLLGIHACYLTVILIGYAHADQPRIDQTQDEQNQIVLKSPNGRFRVTIAAADSGAGIWVEDTRDHKVGTVVVGRDESTRFIAVSDSRKAPKFPLVEEGLKDQSKYVR